VWVCSFGFLGPFCVLPPPFGGGFLVFWFGGGLGHRVWGGGGKTKKKGDLGWGGEWGNPVVFVGGGLGFFFFHIFPVPTKFVSQGGGDPVFFFFVENFSIGLGQGRGKKFSQV